MASIYNVLSIVRGTTVDGPGFRTSIYLAGCTHQCPGCHNPQSWSFDAGTPMTLEEIMEIVREEDFDVTLSGGDPLCSPESTLRLVEALKADHRNIWLYTGYTWEEIIATSSHSPSYSQPKSRLSSGATLPPATTTSPSLPTSPSKSLPTPPSTTIPTPSTLISPVPTLFDIVKQVDVVVEGPYIAALRDPDLLFRGSSNQRLINIPATLSQSPSLTTPSKFPSLVTPILYR